MTRDAVHAMLVQAFSRLFEIEDPAMDEDLREAHDFDSIDAIELLTEVEDYLGRELDQEEKKQAMEIRTLRDIEDYVLRMQGA
jgi:acyl carrier protein